jgi:hypothetical protein
MLNAVASIELGVKLVLEVEVTAAALNNCSSIGVL